jgi:hypothetical protein
VQRHRGQQQGDGGDAEDPAVRGAAGHECQGRGQDDRQYDEEQGAVGASAAYGQHEDDDPEGGYQAGEDR